MPRPKTSSQEIDSIILTKMLQAGNNYISGNTLAKELNTSRVSVWGHLEKLRKDGFDFKAIRNRGYHLKKVPDELHPGILRARLNLHGERVPIAFLKETDSTNSEAERQLATGCSTPLVVVASKQTAGRGRHGRKWASSSGGNLYVSFAFKPNLTPEKMQMFTLWIAVQICDLLNKEYNVPIQVKWPNDLVLQGKKVSGFLAEARIDADHTRDLVLGIGLNINGDPDSLPPEIRKLATSLKAFSGKPLPMNDLVASFIARVLKAYRTFIDGDYAEEFTALWEAYDSLYRQEITGYQGLETIKGRVIGIDDEGCLKLARDDGTIRCLHAADITLSKPLT